MRLVCFGLIVVALVVAASGCTRAQRAEAPIPDGTVLAEGKRILDGGRAWWLDFGGVDRPGVLTATIRWHGPPTKLTAAFRHGSRRNRAWVRKRKPLVVRVRVTAQDVAAGPTWRLYLSNHGRCGKTAHTRYTITFKPD